MTQALEDFFTGSVTAAKFEDKAYATVIGGEIVEDPRMQQQRDYESGEPLAYPDGNPVMQMVIVVQAQEPTADDDGRRAFYVKGQMKQAIGDALRKHNVKAPARRGKLWVRYTADKPTVLKNGKPGNAQKLYDAKYEPPTEAAAGAFFDTPPAGGATVAAPPAGAPLACPAGIDPGKWAAMTAVQRQGLYTALGLDPDVEPPPF